MGSPARCLRCDDALLFGLVCVRACARAYEKVSQHYEVICLSDSTTITQQLERKKTPRRILNKTTHSQHESQDVPMNVMSIFMFLC